MKLRIGKRLFVKHDTTPLYVVDQRESHAEHTHYMDDPDQREVRLYGIITRNGFIGIVRGATK